MSGVVTGGVHNAPSFMWNPDTVAQLRRLLEDGKTASECGAAIGCSRNAVIGKVTRDKSLPRFTRDNGHTAKVEKLASAPLRKVSLPGSGALANGTAKPLRHSNINRGHDSQAQKARVETARAIAAGTLAPPVNPPKFDLVFTEGYLGQQAGVRSIHTLRDRHCRFPIDLASGGVGYCGEQREDHSSYCAHHAARCFNPNSAAMRKRVAS